jgi:hypothetical protein
MNVSAQRLVALVAALSLPAALACRREPAAPPAPASAARPRQGGQVVVAAFADVTTFNDYQSAGEVTESEIIDLLYPTLRWSSQLPAAPLISPRLATS